MKQLRFKIAKADAANIEIMPLEDGVEIIVNYGSKAVKVSQEKNNVGRLKDFCGEMKEEPGVNMKELKSFYRFYEGKAEDWRGNMDCEKLWKRWQGTAK